MMTRLFLSRQRKLFLLLMLSLCSANVFAAPGDLDTSFGTGGKVTAVIGVNVYSGSVAKSVIQQSDGKLVAAGYSGNGIDNDFTLVRYNSNSTLDVSFDSDGKLTTDLGGQDLAYSVIQQMDGKLVVAGGTTLARYNSDGSLDTSFDGDGKVTITDLSRNYSSVIQQADGKLVAAGVNVSAEVSHPGQIDFALDRYNSDGSLDTTFSGDGKLTTDMGMGFRDYASSVIQQMDGKLVVVGYIYNGSNPGASYYFGYCRCDWYIALARYNSDGSLDTSFDSDGKLTIQSGQGRSVIQQMDGKLVVSANSDVSNQWDFTLMRFNSDGSLDATFDGDGKVTTDISGSDDWVGDVIQQASGKLVLVGASSGGMTMVRYNSDGSLDTGFSGDGIFISGSNDGAESVIEQTDGKLVAAGYTNANGMPAPNGTVNPGANNFGLWRIEGVLDTDSDGISDDIDTDDDNDGMPDIYETAYGFNPLVNDAAGDADSDGVSNVQEFTNVTNPIVAPAWTQLSPTDTPPAIRTVHSAVFNPTHNRMIAFGGMNGPGVIITHPLFNDVWVLTNADGTAAPSTWVQLTPTGTPPSARGMHGAVYDVTNNRMMVYGGDPGIGGCYAAVNDTWVLSNADGVGGTPAWTQLSPTGGPPALRQSPSAVYDSVTNNLIVFGGRDNACGTLSNAVWVLSNANGLGGTPMWTQLSPAGAPPAARQSHTAVYDSANNRMIVFGGVTDSGSVNDVWVLSNANGSGGTPAWTQLVPTGTPPVVRNGHTASYNALANRMTIYGGDGSAPARLSDVWALQNANGLNGTARWTQVSPAGGVPGGRSTHSLVYNAATDRLIAFAGRTCTGGCSGPEFSALNDVWVMSGDAADTDGDRVDNLTDNCSLISNADQANLDSDSYGDVCDADIDGDGVVNGSDAFPLDATKSGDTDNDGVDNLSDNCPLVSNASQLNTDGDAQGNACDADDDNDGVLDHSSPIKVSAGWYHSCALDATGVHCWGKNDFGQSTVPALINPVAISAGGNYSCALDATGVHCWGQNLYGQTNVPALVSPVMVSAGYQHSCALDATGVHCWGDFASGKRTVPALVSPVMVSAGYQHTCALDATGVHCWGDNSYGQTTVPALVNPVMVSAGGVHSCALDATGVHCWGDDTYGQSTVPALVNPVAVTASYVYSCALDDTGVHCWGWNGYGQTTVPTLVSPVAVSASYSHTCAVDDAGVQCWGNNPYGQTAVPALIPPGDNCPLASNASQTDTDGDGAGNACDSTPNGDTDSDGVDNLADNCPLISNASQTDTDSDGAGDACDSTPNGDTDSDGVDNLADNCPLISNASQTDTDGDGAGDACDSTPNGDTDSDGIDNNSDNCPAVSNTSQANLDGDTYGDACDTDIDGDGVANGSDAFPNNPAESADTDGDGVGNNSDNCRVTANADQADADSNGFGDVCDNATQNGAAASDNFGSAIAVADMNNDGYDDLVIGIPGKDISSKKKDAGQIIIISGSDGAVLNTFTGTKANQRFGSAIAVVEDQNSDGVPDLIVGSPLYDASSTKKDTGKVELYSGANGLLLQLIAKGSKAGDQLGASVAVADIDNDGNPNLIVGAPRRDLVGLKDAGQVTVYSGINSTVLYQRNGTQMGEQFGSSVAVDEDLHQLLVGSPYYDVNNGSLLSNAGRVSIFACADGVSAALFILDGTTAENHFGSSVASFSEDLNGDTFNEWAVGSALADPSAKLDAGQVEIFSGFNATPIATIEGVTAGDNFGAALAIGDSNNDGENDLAIGSPKFDVPLVDAGRVEVLSGGLF